MKPVTTDKKDDVFYVLHHPEKGFFTEFDDEEAGGVDTVHDFNDDVWASQNEESLKNLLLEYSRLTGFKIVRVYEKVETVREFQYP